ncbi:cytochrome c3 family protein [bacterium]|nr:cytochrome c3 family protein [bacterium]
MKINLVSLLLITALTAGVNAQQSPGKDHAKLSISCKTCHTCDVPKKDEPCLVQCPREKIVTIYQKPEQTPELIIMDQILDRYGPVYFSHKLHAQMSVMSGGCENCHHHNTSGPILQCNSCHELSRKREDVSLPDLKGAYHRQCMDCHREWSHKTGCNSCHELKKDFKDTKQDDIHKKYLGKDHPVILEPSHISYETNSDKGKLVTFYHDDHTKKFGLACAGCHKQETCAKCHDVNKKFNGKVKSANINRTFEEQHKNCISCHKDDKCSSCHSETKLEPFDHTINARWALGKYHERLSCAKCHGSKLPYKKIDNACLSCHKDWNKENFKHSVTGLILDETHLELGCEDCHSNNNYALKPNCSGCHDNYVYPKQKPGKLVNK